MGILPQILTTTDGKEHSTDPVSYDLIKKRTVYLIGEVNNESAISIITQLKYLDGKSGNDINLIIDSPGGSVADGLAIHDVMKSLHCDVSTIGVGQACSMGAFLLAAGTHGKRYVTPNTEVMIHQPLGGVKTIASNCGVRIVYRVLDFETLSELSKLCGERELSFDGHLTKEPLITPSQLAAMETGQALVMVSGKVKFITWLPDFTEMDIAKYRPPKIAGLKQRHSSKYSYFDIQEFVKRVKHKERYKDNDLYVPVPEEPFVRTNPFLPSEIMTQQELDDIIKRIDKELADFEVEEKKKKKGTNNKVRVVVTCKKDKINKLCHIISKNAHKSITEIKKALDENQTVSLTFNNMNDALDFIGLIDIEDGSARIVNDD